MRKSRTGGAKRLSVDAKFQKPEAQPFLFEGDRHGVLVIHGFTGSVAHMRPLGERLRDAGMTVMGINLPGHAQSMADMGKTGWKDWLNAARDAAKDLRRRCDTVSAVGLSMGGVITLILAEEGLVDSAISISAPMAAQNKLLALAGVLSVFKPVFLWDGDPDPAKPKPEPKVDPRYDLGYEGFPTRCGQSLYKLISMAKKDLGRITCPLMSVQSRTDETITADSLDIIQQGAKSEVKRALWVTDVPHVCVISKEQEHIAQECVRLLRETEGKR